MADKDKKVKAEKNPERFYVAKDKEVTTKRGQLKPGTEVYPIDFPEGKKRIEQLIKLGALDAK